jgi:hypothetical protein
VFLGDGRWTDALATATHAGPRASLPRESWNAYIYRRLGHLAVNPSRKASTEALLSSYAFPAESSHGRDQVANESEHTASDFVDSLIELAKNQLDLWQTAPSRPDPVEHQLSSPNLTLLIGARGSGKTFFLNYLLSRHHARLNEQRVVWVRLDLTQRFFLRPEDLESVSIEDWVFAQATKILYRYYDEASIYSSDKPIRLRIDSVLHDHIEQQPDPPEEKDALHEKRRKMRELFPIVHRGDEHEAASAEAPLSQGLVPSDLGLVVVNYALRKGYAFIVVFDGLDVLDCSLREHLTFLRYNAAVQRLARDHGRLGMTYVASTRMHEGTQQYQSQYDVAPERAYHVAPVSFDRILKQRLRFILCEEKYITGLSGYPSNLALQDHLSGFLEYLSSFEEETGPRARFIGLLTQALGHNRRAQMQVTQIQYGDYVLGTTAQPYRMIEALVTEDGWLPRQRYEHLRGAGGWLVPHRLGARPFDSRLLPTLYNFPLEAEGLLQDLVLSGKYVLANLRILQLALAPRRLSLKKPEAKFPDLAVHELGDLLSSLFGYDPRVVYGLIQELSEYELIWLSAYSHESPASVDRACIRPLPKAYWLLEFAASDVAFLNLAAMRCPFRVQPHGSGGLFKVLPLPSDGRAGELNKWILCKVTNALAMTRIIGHWARRQRSRVDAWMETDGKQKKYGRLAQYVRVALMGEDQQQMERRVVAQIDAILKGVEVRLGKAASATMAEAVEGFLEAHL